LDASESYDFLSTAKWILSLTAKIDCIYFLYFCTDGNI